MTGAFRELELLEGVYARNAALPASVLIPPGDDMAAVAFGSETLLIAVDQVVGGRHFVASTPPTSIGRKAVVRNVSDVAAMAARPVATVVAAALPADYGRERSEALFEGLRSTAERYGCPLVGGDITIHADPAAPLVCSVTIVARPAWPGARVVSRRGARVGDGVYVTGALGGSFEPDGGGRHLAAEPRVEEAIGLLKHLGERLHAMIDVSDGVGRDAAHLVERDRDLAIEIDADRVPCAEGLGWRRALSDGEDYELLFVAEGAVPERVGAVAVTRIGAVRVRGVGEAAVLVREGESLHDASRWGWEHGR